MRLQDFKREAQRRGHFFDNSANAAQAWARSWGLTYHSLLWAYKEYTIGDLRWKGGKVRLRHGSYDSVSCYINGEPVSEYRFKKALETFDLPELTAEEQAYIEAQEKALKEQMTTQAMRRKTSRRKRRTDDSNWPTLNFAVA